MKQTDKNIIHSTEGKTGCLETMRYISVIVMTIWEFLLLDASLSTNEWHLITWWIITITILLPILGFWIYSFVKAVMKRTKNDYILLCFHIANVLLFVLAIFLRQQTGHKFFPFIQ